MVVAAFGIAALVGCFPVRERIYPAVTGRVADVEGRPAVGVPLALVTSRRDTTCTPVSANTRTAPDGSFVFPAGHRWGLRVLGLHADAMFAWRVCAPESGREGAGRLVPVYAASAFGGMTAPAVDSISCTWVTRVDSTADSTVAPARVWRCARTGYRRWN